MAVAGAMTAKKRHEQKDIGKNPDSFYNKMRSMLGYGE